ncbi:MAG TPA: hypothetical protein VMY42_02410 [Thermoguttaceae bacterium]|nr:hypothetical protein [Thermoguttaceae bacterium]
MPKKNIHYYLIKTARISGWLLLPLMLLYLVTGFAIIGQFGLNELIEPNKARFIHQDFLWPLTALFLIHASITIYFAFRRWGWIKTKSRK